VNGATLVVYTTPALRDLLEKDVGPKFTQRTGTPLSFVYVPAGQQYNRLRLSPGHEEADVLLHASPLYLVEGAHHGLLRSYALGDAAPRPPYAENASGGDVAWAAFAWSPLVEVFNPRLGAPPDLATSTLPFGFAHPLLSNNGVYTVLLFEATDPAAGARALQHTRVQPVNARANIGGVTDGSFDVTVGYEAVALFYQDQGAKVGLALPLVDNRTYVAPVLFTAGIVAGDTHPQAEALVRFLFGPDVQRDLAKYHFRSPFTDATSDAHALDLAHGQRLDFDWTRAEDIDARLPGYVVTS
jgi:ABC-type Fe3+ transport system substrate-binding protein